MTHASDAKKAAEKYLTSENGQLKRIDDQINQESTQGKFSTEYPNMSDYSKEQLIANGFTIEGDKISW